ncbi:MAG: hypothetical protein HoeaKO_08180 [Hoeflea alexandrii]
MAELQTRMAKAIIAIRWAALVSSVADASAAKRSKTGVSRATKWGGNSLPAVSINVMVGLQSVYCAVTMTWRR